MKMAEINGGWSDHHLHTSTGIILQAHPQKCHQEIKSPAENRAFYKGQWWVFWGRRISWGETWHWLEGFYTLKKFPWFSNEKMLPAQPRPGAVLGDLKNAEWIRVAVVIGWWYSFGCEGFRGWNSEVRWHGKGIKSGMILHLLNFHKDISNPGWFY